MKRGLPLIVLISLWMGWTGCTSPASPTPSALPISTSTRKAGLTQPVPSATLPVSPTPRPVPPIPSHPSVIVLAGNLAGPDDLLLAPDGSIYISDVVQGEILRYETGGGFQPVAAGLDEPEGMVFLPDGSLVVAEQGRNRLVRINPGGGPPTQFLLLHNSTGQPGVDGIALDQHPPGPASIIIPDSPNGVVLRAGLDGKTVTETARGFARPTGAWVEPDGSILVVEENGNALDRILPTGEVEKLASLPTPDDVIEDADGNIFVNTMGDGAIHLIRADTGLDAILVSGLSDPQGIIFDAQGNLIVTDAGHHRLIRIVIH